MLELHYSNHTEMLVDVLIERIEVQRTQDADPFEPVVVVVPNRNLATYLKYEMARRTGIASNLKIFYLNQFFKNLANLEAQSPPVHRNALRELLIARFVDSPPAPVARYLDYARDHSDDRDRRIFQLADRISRLFDEYALARPRMMETWPDGTSLQDNENYAETEIWQRQLWLEVLGEDGALNELIPGALTLTQLLTQLQPTQAPSVVHVFGFSYVARLYYDALNRLSQNSKVLVYTLNPCMEFWEDVPSGWKLSRKDKKRFEKRAESQPSMLDDEREELFSDDQDPPALRLWGRPGRDNIRLLNMLTDCDFEAHFVDPMLAGDTLLHRFQHDILVRQPVNQNPSYVYEDDDSLRFLACPSIQREVEVVANEIWSLIRDTAETDEPVTFNDIAIVINHAERDAYQALIRSVFADSHNIPFNMVDVAATGSRRYVEAVGLLLNLPFGRFTRSEFLKLLTHPNVISQCPGVDPDDWIRWCDELNILHGADHNDHAGSYIERELFHWDQGLKRLALGAFMGGRFADQDTTFSDQSGELYLPHELHTQDVGSASKFIAITRSLIKDARRLRTEEKPLQEWFKTVAEIIDTYLLPADDDDEFDRKRTLERIEELHEDSITETPVSYRFAHQAILQALNSLEIQRGHYLADGVTVSSFLPMRPIPFRAVFVTGMGEKHFPRPDLRSPLDLRWATSRYWDNFSSRRQDEYMFLETLISTRDRLAVSWVARDAHTGEPLQPSSVVRELRFMLTRHYIEESELETRTIQHPLRRFDAAYRSPETPGSVFQIEALQEARVARLRADLKTHVTSPPSALQAYERALDAPSWASLQKMLGLIKIPDTDSEKTAFGAGRYEVSINTIRQFLKTPLQGAASFFLGMRDDSPEDVYTRENEVFQTGGRERFALLRDVFLTYVRLEETGERTSFEELYDKRALLLELQGVLPTGLFARSDREAHLTILHQWKRNLNTLAVGKNQPLTVLNFGRTTEKSATVAFHEPVRLDITHPHTGAPIAIDIVGKTDPFDPTLRASMILTASPKLGTEWKDEHIFMQGFLDMALLIASGVISGPDFKVALNANRGAHSRGDFRTFDVLTQKDAQDWLECLLGDMVSGVHAYLLPIEAAFEYRLQRTTHRPLFRIVDQMKNQRYRHLAFRYGPVRNPERFSAAPDGDEIIDRRFGPYFGRVR